MDKDVAYIKYLSKIGARGTVLRHLMAAIGLDLLFINNLMKRDNATVPMRDNSWFQETSSHSYGMELLSMHDPISTEVDRIQNILILNMLQQIYTK